MRLVDTLPWHDRLKALGLILLLLAALYWLTGCGGELPEEPPDTQPMAAQTYVYFWPFIFIAGGNKSGVGVATQQAQFVQENSLRSLGFSWFYNWSLDKNLAGTPNQDVAFVPMLWSASIGEISSIKDCPSLLFWLNEPNEPGQAVTSPLEAITKLENILDKCPNSELVGPHIAPRDRHNNWQWIREFYSLWIEKHAYLPPTEPALHIYDHPSAFKRTIDTYYSALSEFGIDETSKITISEWNVPCGDRSPREIKPLVQDAYNILENDPRVIRHAIFVLHNGGMWQGLECGEIIDSEGNRTPVGDIFNAYP